MGDNSKQKEMEIFLSAFPEKNNPLLFLLDDEGKSLDTHEWAGLLKSAEESSQKHIVFGIGSHQGFHDDLLKRATQKISFGKQTLSHEIARLVLIEQLYRATSINRGHPYHHD